MTGPRRREVLAGVGVAGTAAVGGCLSLLSSDRPVETTLSPASGENPATLPVEASAGRVLTVEVSSRDQTVFDLFDRASGRSLAAGGTGLVERTSLPVESDPLPETDGGYSLVVSMQPEDQVSVRVSKRDQARPTDSPARLREQVAAVTEAFGTRPRPTTAGAFSVVGPLWLRLFETKLSTLEPGATTGPAEAEVQTARKAVYGGLVRRRVPGWADERTATLATRLGAAATAEVAASTGLSVTAVEARLEQAVRRAVERGRATWSYADLDLPSLDSDTVTTLRATATVSLTIEDTSVGVEMPLDLRVGLDAGPPPASAEVRGFQLLTDAVVVE